MTTTLEGHVHLIFTRPTGGPVQITVLNTDRAVLVGHPDGTTEVQVDEGTMRAVLPPETVGPDIPMQLSRANPSQLTPTFSHADIGQVAEAVAFATHKTLIIDPRVHAQLTMLSMAPMTPAAFYQAFVDVLRTGDFVALPMGPANNVIKITIAQ